MEVVLLNGIDYKKLEILLKEYVEEKDLDKVIEKIKEVEKNRRTEIVSAAGRLSRFPGDVLEVLENSENKSLQANAKFVNRVVSMGHKSITDHDYLVFAIKDVSVIIEQMIIAERFSSFTIKSRREVDFSNSGYYVPDFHDKDGRLFNCNNEIKREYQKHMDFLFKNYKDQVDKGISYEDARFMLPYCFYSNIIMGIDAHTLLDMIIKFTKTKYAKIDEFREFGFKLYEIVKEYTPYLIPTIDSIEVNYEDEVSEYLSKYIEKHDYKIIDKVKLLNSSSSVDDTILISAIMRRYQYDYKTARRIYDHFLSEEVKQELMRKIAFNSDELELSQVNFDFQIPVSYAILTHLTRHRTHKLMVPDFVPNIDLSQYKTPPVFKNSQVYYDEIFKLNKGKYEDLKKLGIRDEDLIYFTLSGNMTNIVTNMDGWTVRHILELRECNKAQWETREIANAIHDEIRTLEHAKMYSNILGATCTTQGVCNEGKESCGKVKVLKNINERKNN